jgi:hypothetical protein
LECPVSTADVLFLPLLFAFGAVRDPAFGKVCSSLIIVALEEEELTEEIEGVCKLLNFGTLPLRFLGLFA